MHQTTDGSWEAMRRQDDSRPVSNDVLRGVHPFLWNKTRERLAAIQGFLALDTPTAADQARFAASVGLSTGYFQILVREWQLKGEACCLPGTTFDNRGHGGSAGRLNTAQRAVALSSMATSSADTPVEQILAVIRQRCRQNRLSAPPANAVIAAIERNRSARISYPDSRMIIVDHCAIELPSRLPTASLRLPVVAFAIAVPELRILAWEAAFAAPTPQVTAALLMKLLIRAADESQAPDTRQLKLNMGRSAGWWNLRRTLRRAGVQRTGRSAVPVPSGRDIPGLIGNYLWDLRLRPNLTHRPEAITSVPEEHILSADDAQQAIAYAAELHNGSLPAAEASVALQQPSALQRMLMELGEIAGTDPEPARQRT